MNLAFTPYILVEVKLVVETLVNNPVIALNAPETYRLVVVTLVKRPAVEETFKLVSKSMFPSGALK